MSEQPTQPRPLEYQSGVKVPKAKVVRRIADAPVTRVEKWIAIVAIVIAVLVVSALVLRTALTEGVHF